MKKMRTVQSPRSTPKSAVLDANLREIMIGRIESSDQNGLLIAAFFVSESAVVSFELRDSCGNVVSAVRRSGRGPIRVSLKIGESCEEGAVSAWISLIEPKHAVSVSDIRLYIDALTEPSTLDLWALLGADRVGDDIVVAAGASMTLTSPPLDIEDGASYLVDGDALVEGEAKVRVWLDGSNGQRYAERVFEASGDWAFVNPCRMATSSSVRIVLSLSNCSSNDLCIIRVPRIVLRQLPRWTSRFDEMDTSLPHWSRWQRSIHNRCKASRSFNNFVSGVEMRLGRAELLSLPQYMAICPTGQCNAQCAFCSVAVNRTGIVKQQLGQEALSKFVSPVRRCVMVFGLEGNGEPTLHREFLHLLGEVTSGGTDAYLITNASRIDCEMLKCLLLLESVNISLNAATAETHRRVMKLQDFEESVTAIKSLVSLRGKLSDGTVAPPRISVSFVVTADNIHEVQEFLSFAEDDLGVDVVYIRPLSQLGNELGVVEDVRQIVPFESDIRDMFEAIGDYIRDRRKTLDIRFDPQTFRSSRPDPVGQILMPYGCEQRLLAPRRSGWVHAQSAKIVWVLSKVHLVLPKAASDDCAMESLPIPIKSDCTLQFCAEIHVVSGELLLSIADADTGDVLASAEISEDVAVRQVAATVYTGKCRALVIRFNAPLGVVADIDLGRTRNPIPMVSDSFKLPEPSRWERGVADVEIRWQQRSVTVESAAAPGMYLLRSFNTSCAPGRIVHLPVKATFTRGNAGVGVLSGDGSKFLAVSNLEGREDEAVLTFRTAGNLTVAVVIYGLVTGGTAGTLSFGEPETMLDPDWRPESDVSSEMSPSAKVQVRDKDELITSNESTQIEDAPAQRSLVYRPSVRRTWKRKLRDFIMGRDRIYCHKPWTDMHNFSVDGRVDVCCIATGASQEYYQLGNLMKQSFQDVWNGARAMEFRSTVNSDRQLQPCARCPMSRAYQGAWFDPIHTMGQFRSLFFSREIFNRKYTRYVGYSGYFLGWIVIQFIIFRGFKRHPLAGLGRLGTVIGRKLGI